jgi:hypothetical protein
VHPSDDPRIQALTRLVQSGEVESVIALIEEHPELATDRHGDGEQSRTALHIATDWPGNFPRVAESIAALVDAGAPVNGRFAGPHGETPLHWAASSDDVAAIDALLDAGADIEADGAVLTGGTPLADAVVFAQLKAARRLVERGASMTIWQAAALGEIDELRRHLETCRHSVEEITNAGWHACRSGHLAAVQLLVEQGADLDWLGYMDLTSRQAGLQSDSAALVAWLGANR